MNKIKPTHFHLLIHTHWFTFRNEGFASISRRSMNALTAVKCLIFQGLNLESNNESGKKRRFRMKTNWIIALFILLPLLHFSIASAENLQGAAAVLEKIKVELEKERSGPSFPFPTNPAEVTNKGFDSKEIKHRLQLASDMEKYSKDKKNLNADEAATQWLDLVERFLGFSKISPEQCMSAGRDNCRRLIKTMEIQSIIEIMPGPRAWKQLAAKCNSKLSQKSALPAGYQTINMFVNLLNADTSKAAKRLSDLEMNIKNKSSFYTADMVKLFEEVRNEIKRFEDVNDYKNDLELFEQAIARHKLDSAKSEIITVPNLYDYVSEEKARELLENALAQSTMYLIIPTGDKTRVLANKIILEMREVIKRPQWGLAYSIDTFNLFGENEKKYSKPLKGIFSVLSRMILEDKQNRLDIEAQLKPRAVSYYLLELLGKDSHDEAVEYASKLTSKTLSSNELLKALKETGKADLYPAYFEFLQNLLQRKPQLSFWQQYVDFGLALDRSDECLDTINTVLSQDQVSFMKKFALRENQIDIHLALDRVDKALLVIREILTLKGEALNQEGNTEYIEKQFDMAVKLVKLGKVLKRNDMIDEGFSAAKLSLKRISENSKDGFYSSYKVIKIINLLISTERYQEAEDLVVKNSLTELSQMRNTYSTHYLYTINEYLAKLTDIYIASERYEDVLLLLDESPLWGKHDLAELDNNLFDLHINAAKALQHKGEKEEAIAILKTYLLEKTNDDDAFKLLVSMTGEEIIPWLDQLYSANRFEERPLIWKAYILQKSKKYDEAEKVVRQAMKIDPTDGEQKEGQRIFSYSLLADILTKKGNDEEAKFFRNIVESVHIAEQGDRFSKAGLLQRSIEYYNNAMALFADAYCIQWRLGERLYAMGDIEGSKKHYKVAFERMPEQFGQVASFCFGCEGAFDKLQSRNVAEEVFSHLLEVTPKKPQVYFLFGLLRKSQHRNSEAYSYFKKAVELDDEYLDAWEEIVDISDKVSFSQAEKDRIVLKILHLDPLQQHFTPDLENMVDVKNLWLTLDDNLKYLAEKPDSLYKLKASSAYLKSKEKDSTKTTDYYYDFFFDELRSKGKLRPGKALCQLRFVDTMPELIALEKTE